MRQHKGGSEMFAVNPAHRHALHGAAASNTHRCSRLDGRAAAELGGASNKACHRGRHSGHHLVELIDQNVKLTVNCGCASGMHYGHRAAAA